MPGPTQLVLSDLSEEERFLPERAPIFATSPVKRGRGSGRSVEPTWPRVEEAAASAVRAMNFTLWSFRNPSGAVVRLSTARPR